mmetsp:Transcript_5409/g.18220  ORF Transcript_5409/g.18220 Transcript_5409/m.18220 type:complete len:1162 (-) Transcript_5409:644-4129(-)
MLDGRATSSVGCSTAGVLTSSAMLAGGTSRAQSRLSSPTPQGTRGSGAGGRQRLDGKASSSSRPSSRSSSPARVFDARVMATAYRSGAGDGRSRAATRMRAGPWVGTSTTAGGNSRHLRGAGVKTRVLFGNDASAADIDDAIELEAPASVAKECFYEESYAATQRVRVANKLTMKVETNGVRYRVSVETDLASEHLLLHWGVAPTKEHWDQWMTPAENIRPPLTTETVGVCQTMFTQSQTGRMDEGKLNCVIEGNIIDGDYAINFVLFDKKLEQWLHQEKGGFFHVPLPQPPAPEFVTTTLSVVEEYEEEVEEIVYEEEEEDKPPTPAMAEDAVTVTTPDADETDGAVMFSFDEDEDATPSPDGLTSRVMAPPVDPQPLADKTDLGVFASGIQAMKKLLRGSTFDVEEVLAISETPTLIPLSAMDDVQATIEEKEEEIMPPVMNGPIEEPPVFEIEPVVEGPVAPPQPKTIKKMVKKLRTIQREVREALPVKLVEGSWVITNTIEEVVHNEKEVQYTIGALVEKDPKGGGVRLRVEAEVPWNLVLHWGIVPRGARADVWSLPPESWRPMGSSVYKDKACETPMKRFESSLYGLSTLNYVELELGNAPTAVRFVLKEANGTRWVDHNGDDFVIPMPEASAASSTLDAKSQQDMRDATDVAMAAVARAAEMNLNSIVEVADVAVLEPEVEKDVEVEVEVAPKPEISIMDDEDDEEEIVVAKAAPVIEGPELVEVDQAPDVVVAPPTPEPVPVPVKTASSRVTSAVGNGREILLQGFNWESSKSPSSWYANVENLADTIGRIGFTVIWLPPPTDSVSLEGYMPRDYYDLNSRYGTVDELKSLIKALRRNGVMSLGDAVLNHRCAHSQGPEGLWNQFGGKLAWDARAIVADDPNFGGKGSPSDGDFFHAAPNVDHSQSFVKADLEEWMQWLQKEVGYDGWRLDYVRGFWGGHVKDYMEATQPGFAVGEFWDALDYKYDAPEYNQDAHRQRIVNWINAAGGLAGAFDVTTKGILHAVFERQEYWRLSDKAGKPPGVMGWWPSRAVTFVENHDTGSTQGHWRFPRGKELQGYAYILTHPGTPTVFWDHIFDNNWGHLHEPIERMISIRKESGVHCRSTVSIVRCEQSVYAAVIDDNLLMKIGPGEFHADGAWKVALSGQDFCIWTKK